MSSMKRHKIERLPTIQEGSNESKGSERREAASIIQRAFRNKKGTVPAKKTYSTLLEEFLDNCNSTSGSYVNSGSYGVGVTYTASRSPMSFLTLSELSTGTVVNDNSVFIKCIPLTTPPVSIYAFIDMIAQRKIDEGDTELRKKMEDVNYLIHKIFDLVKKDVSVLFDYNGHARRFKLSDVPFNSFNKHYSQMMRGLNWKVLGPNYNEVTCTDMHGFLRECETQIDIFKKTNHDLDSFVLPIYEHLIIDRENIHILEQLKDKYSDEGGKKFFNSVIEEINKCEYSKLGIVVMPMMPFPPVSVASRYFYDYGLNVVSPFSDDKSISENLFDNDDVIYDYDDYIPFNKRHSIFMLIQIISNMISLLEHNYIHGDLHMANILIHPQLPTVMDCFDSNGLVLKDDAHLGKAFLIDFGLTKKVSFNKQSFEDKIQYLLRTPGITEDIYPMQSQHVQYQWPYAMFYKKINGSMSYKPQNTEKINEMVQRFNKRKAEFVQRFLTDEMRPLGVTRGGNGKLSEKLQVKMKTMIQNLKHGEESLKRLQRYVHTLDRNVKLGSTGKSLSTSLMKLFPRISLSKSVPNKKSVSKSRKSRKSRKSSSVSESTRKHVKKSARRTVGKRRVLYHRK